MAQTRPREDAQSRNAAKLTKAPLVPRWRFVIRRPLWVFWVLFAINTFNYLDRLIAVAVAPTLKEQFHLSNSDVGALSSAFLLVYTLAALPAGALADRLHARARVVAVGVALWSVFSGLTAFVRSYTGLFATRALVGVGEASYSPASVALLVNYYPRERRASILGRWQAGQILGTLLAFVVAGALFAWLPAHLAWRAAFLLTALPGLALAALAWGIADQPATPPDPIPVEATQSPAEAAAEVAFPAPQSAQRSLATEARALIAQTTQTLRIPMIWFVVVLQALTFIVITPSVTFLPIYVEEARGPFHLSAAHASFALGLALVAGGFLGVVLGGALSDWLNRRLPGGRVLAITVGFFAALPPFLVMLLTTSLPLFLAASTLLTLAINLPAAALTATPQDVTPLRLRATAIAVVMLLSHLFGDIWAAWAVGSLSLALHNQLSLALLVIGAPALALGGAVSLVAARVYARSHAALG